MSHFVSVILTFSMLGRKFSRHNFEVFFSFFFPQKIGFGILCKLSQFA